MLYFKNNMTEILAQYLASKKRNIEFNSNALALIYHISVKLLLFDGWKLDEKSATVLILPWNLFLHWKWNSKLLSYKMYLSDWFIFINVCDSQIHEIEKR